MILSRNHQTVANILAFELKLESAKYQQFDLKFSKYSTNIPQKDALFLVFFCGLFSRL